MTAIGRSRCSGNPPNENPSGQGTFTNNLRFPGQYYDVETGLNQNINRDYDPNTGRYVESDPIGLAGGTFSTYTYVNGNPLSWSDPLGLATLVITSGSYGYNVFGHSALAFTGQGVYSYGTIENYGSSTTDYLNGQLANRNVTITTLNTTPEQEQAMMNYYNNNYGKGANYSTYSNNCANAAAGALTNAGLINPLLTDFTSPYDVQHWASSLPGALTQTLPQGSSFPTSDFGSFNK